MLHYIILLIFGFIQLLQGMGCCPETIVHTPSGMSSLALLHAGDCLVNCVEPPEQLIYDIADYHHPVPLAELHDYLAQHGCSKKSPCPTRIEGQAILQFLSFPAGDKHRLAYVAGILIFFSFTRFTAQGKLYHGHYRLNGISGLAPHAQEVLRKNNIINGKGKFIK